MTTIFGESFRMGGVALTSMIDRMKPIHGYLDVTIDETSTPDQRRSVALLIRQFADELEREE